MRCPVFANLSSVADSLYSFGCPCLYVLYFLLCVVIQGENPVSRLTICHWENFFVRNFCGGGPSITPPPPLLLLTKSTPLSLAQAHPHA